LQAFWYDREQYHDRKRLDFLHILWRARKYVEASRPVDMVYSFLAFDDLTKEFKVRVDYKIHPREIFRNLASSMIKSSQSLQILQRVVATQVPKIAETANVLPRELPSWVPDWSNRRFSGGTPILCPGIPYHFEACRGNKHIWIEGDPHNSNTLYAKGHIIDMIYTVIPNYSEANTYLKMSLRQVLKVE
jgi:hypothetical protein